MQKEYKLNGEVSSSHLQFMRTLNVFVFPVESSLYTTFFTVPQVKVPISNVVPPICNPGKWQRVFLVFRLPLNAYEDPFKVPVFTTALFSSSTNYLNRSRPFTAFFICGNFKMTWWYCYAFVPRSTTVYGFLGVFCVKMGNGKRCYRTRWRF